MERPPQKDQRPRDELGRPLPRGSENRLHMEDYDNLPPDEDHRLAVESFNAQRFFSAHEAWESAWRQLREGDEEEFFHGLAQLGAGFTHYQRGNKHGARVLMRRAVSRILPYAPNHRGINVAALASATEEAAAAIEEAEHAAAPMPSVTFPRV